MATKRKLSNDLSMDKEFKTSKLENKGGKKHSLDSDEDDSEDEEKGHYEILYNDDIEGKLQRNPFNPFAFIVGQEEGISGTDGTIKITPFNMKEELEEGHFDTDGNFHWNKDNSIKDNWQDNIDWMEVKELHKSYKEKNNLEDTLESESQSPFDQIGVYKQILDFMKPGETISKTLRRLGGSKPLSASERLKRKKAGLSNDSDAYSRKVTELTELANRLLTRTGNMDIYQESYQYIKNLVESCESSKHDDPLDMYADDFDEKEKERMERRTSEPKAKTSEESEDKNGVVLMWEYKLEKEDDKIQGPHTTEQMQKYVDEGFFKGEIWVRKVGQDGPFYSSRRIDFQLYL
ncbi:hypothetical protein RUM43_005127 [Polyplax serrata]|uniref:GYF domain-containing protein n=1 Tax=Polyplax serrata TaxID=468196 RepID=A0AAN8XR69_POLSC